MKTPLVSVLMPAYDAEQFIAEAIESVLAQRYQEWEMIIVNDGSTDGTEGIITRYSDPRIKLISQENAGEASARNTALKHINGEYVAFLDADDFLLANHLEVTKNYV